MDWTVVVTTAVGAVIGIASALVLEHARWRNQAKDRRSDTLRSVYAAYLVAVSQAAEQIWQASRAGLSTCDDPVQRSHSAFGDHDVFAKRYELVLLAPGGVATLANDVAWKLVKWSDQVIGGATHDLPDCNAARLSFNQARDSLIEKMRQTLPGTVD
ncbi:hypothetical protein [Streptomyces neyagawaensis]|uniref:hypothetical protein n=1 Tax=Streptomyces neyagawaensis TaxID=42238 RepID=UPI0006E21AE6|nr:hypothetical protein [Streptomyces neyagawaensis]MCL6737440.1 hypothetical protein [Streptomyces neyagawaensis]MDE1688275.1 hypothetical protein [Streptomyces neyagawaensis]